MSREAVNREILGPSRLLLGTCALMLVLGAVAAASGSKATPPARSDLARESRSMKAVCARCHDLQIVMDTPMSYDAWHDTVQTMIDRGATGTDQQFADVMDYLHRNMTTIDVNTADADELQIVLHVPERTARAILARRKTQKFTSLTDLESIPGVRAFTVEVKARMIFFK
jgi:competence protein ComEA